jgi:hypothetical protein
MTTFEEAKDQVAKKHGYENWNYACFVWAGWVKQVEPFMNEAAELYATAKAAQETETLKREIQAYELTVLNLRNGLAQAWEEGANSERKPYFDHQEGLIQPPTNPYKQEKP